MKFEFEDEAGAPRLRRAMEAQAIVRHSGAIASALIDAGALEDVGKGVALLQQGEGGSEFFFILDGGFDIIVNGRPVGERKYGDHLGEIAALDPSQRRAATAKAQVDSVVLRVPGEVIHRLGHDYPDLLEAIAIEANSRLAQRNDREAQCNDQPHVLVISSKEALPVLREFDSLLRDDDFHYRPWNDGGIFDISSYPIPSLEQALREVDFALVIATPDDKTVSRGEEKPTPRDNVTFEMGMAIGRLGLDRTIIVTPSDHTHLGTDLNGLNVLRYRTDRTLTEALRPVAHDLRKHINDRGVNRHGVR